MVVTIVYVWVVSCINYLKLKYEVYDSACFRPQIEVVLKLYHSRLFFEKFI